MVSSAKTDEKIERRTATLWRNVTVSSQLPTNAFLLGVPSLLASRPCNAVRAFLTVRVLLAVGPGQPSSRPSSRRLRRRRWSMFPGSADRAKPAALVITKEGAQGDRRDNRCGLARHRARTEGNIVVLLERCIGIKSVDCSKSQALKQGFVTLLSGAAQRIEDKEVAGESRVRRCGCALDVSVLPNWVAAARDVRYPDRPEGVRPGRSLLIAHRPRHWPRTSYKSVRGPPASWSRRILRPGGLAVSAALGGYRSSRLIQSRRSTVSVTLFVTRHRAPRRAGPRNRWRRSVVSREMVGRPRHPRRGSFGASANLPLRGDFLELPGFCVMSGYHGLGGTGERPRPRKVRMGRLSGR